MNDLQTLAGTENQANNGAAPRAVDWTNPRVAAILSAAATCFARKGFSSTTLAEIGKELGLRKSIVHYYFASKAALIHEVQSYSYHKYLDRVKEAIASVNGAADRAGSSLQALWEGVQSNRTLSELNIEVWSAARRDPELHRRAKALQHDARELVYEGLRNGLEGHDGGLDREALATLTLAVLNGLSVAEYLEGDDVPVKQAYELYASLVSRAAGSGPTAH